MSNIIEITPNFDSVCRCCLKSEQLVEIYQNGTVLNPELAELLQQNYISIKEDDCFPNFVCSACLNCLRDWHNFLIKCGESSRVLEGLHKDYQLEILDDSEQSEEELKHEKLEIEPIFLESTQEQPQDSPREPKPLKKRYDQSRKCPVCNIQVSRGLKEHLLTHEDPTGKPFRCDLCDKSYCRSANLRLHREKEHLLIRYSCQLCGKDFSTRDILAVHQKLHNPEQQYRCKECGQTFKSNKYLYKHQQKHKGVKKFVCSFCGKSFIVGEYLKNHLRIHTGEKPYPCKQCGKTFRISNQLRQHMRTHLKKVGVSSMVEKDEDNRDHREKQENDEL